MGVHEWAQACAVLAFACAGILFLCMLGSLYLVALHRAWRHQGLAREAALLSQPAPPDHALPHVVVQITVCNERAVVARAIRCAAELDWPRDRLHIQVCDDSDDETTDLARAAVAPLARAGLDIQLLRRRDRSGYKAGNLRAAMARTGHDYFAVFDVDYMPPRDFLRRCMPVLIADPGLGFVQARPDYLNADESALTRAAALNLDAHHAIEQATRSWAGHTLPFNGTCGIWRRAAIEAGGGWSGDTLAEDLDLSYRAWLKGWRGVFLTSVFVRGELPGTRRAWFAQQRRWTAGFGQVARTMIPRVLSQPGLPWRARLAAFLHLAMGSAVAPVSDVMGLAAAAAIVLEPSRFPLLAAVMLASFVGGNAAHFIYLRTGHRFLRGSALPLRGFAADFLHFSWLSLQLNLFSGYAHWRALIGRGGVFHRTPKLGSVGFEIDRYTTASDRATL